MDLGQHNVQFVRPYSQISCAHHVQSAQPVTKRARCVASLLRRPPLVPRLSARDVQEQPCVRPAVLRVAPAWRSPF